MGIYDFLKKQLQKGFDPMVWAEDPAVVKTKSTERKYRRVESVDANGNKSYSITYVPEAYENNRKVKLSSVIK
jgi:large subunit ribosomal protein L28